MTGVYDATARAHVRESGLADHYSEHRVRYLALATRLYKVLLARASQDRPLLRGDVQNALSKLLKADNLFMAHATHLYGQLLHGTGESERETMDLKRGFRKWPSYFAGHVIEEDWEGIVSHQRDDEGEPDAES